MEFLSTFGASALVSKAVCPKFCLCLAKTAPLLSTARIAITAESRSDDVMSGDALSLTLWEDAYYKATCHVTRSKIQLLLHPPHSTALKPPAWSFANLLPSRNQNP